MTHESAAARWTRVKTVFDETLNADLASRASVLDRACGADVDLRSEVESLLASHAAADAFLEQSALSGVEHALREPLARAAGGDHRIGHWHVEREIGRGGMGTVYLVARDGAFRQQAALKLIKRGMDTDLIVRRFEHERQILAGLGHQHIAHLLDGGTTDDGRPYFVMEYVDGEPIDRWCDAQKMDVDARLRLFLDVCGAVQHAHRNLIVHRDIKASNILVTRDGVPKLLDFGLAKLLGGDAAGVESIVLFALTPDYASPEQVRGETITTSTDVYSLGVLLFELLAGRRPYAVRGATPDAILRAICESVVERPSVVAPAPLKRRLRGDLDTVVLRALQKDPARRYASVEQMAEDVRRHLARLPLFARPDSLRYRLGTFAKRNRVAVSAAAVVIVALVVGFATAEREARIARADRALAERRFSEVRALATGFLFEVHDEVVGLPGSTPVRELLARRATLALDALASEAQGDPSLQRDLAAAYIRLGDVLGLPYAANLGHTEEALGSYTKSLALLEPLVRVEPYDPEAHRHLSIALERAGTVEQRIGHGDSALVLQRRAVSVADSLLARSPADTAYLRLLARNHRQLGRALMPHGLAGARAGLVELDQALDLWRRLRVMNPTDVSVRSAEAAALESVGYAHWRLGDETAERASYLTALARLHDAWAVRTALSAEMPSDARYRRSVADGEKEMAQLHVKLGDPGTAVSGLQRALIVLRALALSDSTNVEAMRDVAYATQSLAEAQAASGVVAGAGNSARDAETALLRLAKLDSASDEDRLHLASTRALLVALRAKRSPLQ